MSIAAIECLLFVAGEPLPTADIANAVGIDLLEAEQLLRELQISLTKRQSGLQLLSIAGGWQFATRPEYAEYVSKLLARGVGKLSRAALETLAIVAYRQPVTAPEVEAIRGVSSDSVIKTLLERRLIGEAGKKASIGRPMQYRTTADFLHYFGIPDLSRLPELDLDAPPPEPVPASLVADGIVTEV